MQVTVPYMLKYGDHIRVEVRIMVVRTLAVAYALKYAVAVAYMLSPNEAWA